jgi:DNA-binding NarL/FixJ family response regulator
VTIRLVLVDDHPLFLLGLREACRQIDGFDVVGEADCITDALPLIGDVQPDVVVLDVALPDGSGLDVVPRVRAASPTTRILMLTMFDDHGSVAGALRAGAHGYLVKGAGAAVVEQSIRTVAGGGTIVVGTSPEVLLGVTSSADDPFAHLSSREREILALIAAGLDNRSIATRLFLADKTVRNLVSTVLAKIHATDRADARSKARAAGLGGPGR